MITQFFLPQLDYIDVANMMWFQQDNTTCHTANETIQLLHETFPSHVLSRFGDQNWPPRSCDLIRFLFMRLFELKSMSTIPQPHMHYKTKLNVALMKFSHLCRKVMKNFDERVRMCQQSHGVICPMLFHK